MKRVLNIDEACEFLGYKKKSIYNLTSLGILPYSKPNGKKLYFDRELLEKWMLSNSSETNIDKIAETFVALD
jgi:excisionase family DNA binding protein